ncbi:hypothetical protein SDC9_105167 [bioreactor metagenome]|uniref:DUF4340 domain-containing protein n=1 Tax=bioreactor metagenome TaxID=1076179 RepID=A0A645AZW3_9ZZZZ
MKRTKKMAVLAVILVIVLGGYFALSRLTSKEAESADEEKAVTVASLDSASVSQFAWTRGDVSITLQKTSGGWQYSEDPTFPLNQDNVDTMLTAVSKIEATREISDASELSEYGLDKPSCTITATTSGGEETKLSIGNKNDLTSEYYLTLNGGKTVYTVDDTLLKAFPDSLFSIVRMEQLPDMTQVNSFTVEKPDGRMTLVYREDGKEISYSDKYSWFYEDASALKPVDTEKATTLVDNITNLSWTSCLSYNADESTLSTYGLDAPRGKVTVEHKTENENGSTQGTLVLLIGSVSGDNCCVKLENSGMVYQIAASTADALLNAGYATVYPDDICAMNWDTVTSIDASVNGKSADVSFVRSQTADQSGKAQETTAYSVNGTEADSAKVQDFLESIYSMKSSGTPASSAPSSGAEVTLVFHRSTETGETMTLTLSACDGSSYLAVFDGETRLVSKDYVTVLENAFTAMAQA